VFGFSFAELIVVILVALVVMGPKDLPKMLRRVGQWAGKIRRAAADLRAQSGIDDALRSEGLADDINEIRKLARGELDAVRQVANVSADDLNGKSGNSGDNYSRGDDFYVVRDREYPREGPDSYNALPENAIVYADNLPRSPLHRDPLYRMGDLNAEVPADPEPDPQPPIEGEVGPTLMGIGADELHAKETSETSTETPEPTPQEPGKTSSSSSEAGPTLVGVGALEPEKNPAARQSS